MYKVVAVYTVTISAKLCNPSFDKRFVHLKIYTHRFTQLCLERPTANVVNNHFLSKGVIQ